MPFIGYRIDHGGGPGHGNDWQRRNTARFHRACDERSEHAEHHEVRGFSKDEVRKIVL